MKCEFVLGMLDVVGQEKSWMRLLPPGQIRVAIVFHGFYVGTLRAHH